MAMVICTTSPAFKRIQASVRQANIKDSDVRKWNAAARLDRFRDIRPRWRKIADEVCEKHGVDLSHVLEHNKSGFVSEARQEMAFRLYKETKYSLQQISVFMKRNRAVLSRSIHKYDRESNMVLSEGRIRHGKQRMLQAIITAGPRGITPQELIPVFYQDRKPAPCAVDVIRGNLGAIKRYLESRGEALECVRTKTVYVYQPSRKAKP